MIEFDRSEEYCQKIFLDALDRHVVMDAKITFIREGTKVKARCESINTYGVNLQFPRALRRVGRILIADVIKASNTRGRVFYRAYKGSIRDLDGKVLG